ncbi:phage tail tube protein, partial [Microbulbifer okhotskensis]
MSQLAQGSNIYFIDPADDSVQKVTGVNSFNPGGNPA